MDWAIMGEAVPQLFTGLWATIRICALAMVFGSVILLPQAVRAFLPPMTNELISLVKGSAILSVISVYELTRAGQAIIASNFVPVEIYLLLAVNYYVLISAISFVSRTIERRLPA